MEGILVFWQQLVDFHFSPPLHLWPPLGFCNSISSKQFMAHRQGVQISISVPVLHGLVCSACTIFSRPSIGTIHCQCNTVHRSYHMAKFSKPAPVLHWQRLHAPPAPIWALPLVPTRSHSNHYKHRPFSSCRIDLFAIIILDKHISFFFVFLWCGYLDCELMCISWGTE